MEVYIDDMIVKNTQDTKHGEDLWGTLKNKGMTCGSTLRRASSEFGRANSWFIISRSGIKANLDKVYAVLDMRPPRNVKEVHRLTGFISKLAISTNLSSGSFEILHTLHGIRRRMTPFNH